MTRLLLLVLAAATMLSSGSVVAQQKPDCSPTAGLTFICGLQNPEDVVVMPGNRWLLTSGMAPGAGLAAVDTQTKTVRKVFAPGTAEMSVTFRLVRQSRFRMDETLLLSGANVNFRMLQASRPTPLSAVVADPRVCFPMGTTCQLLTVSSPGGYQSRRLAGS